MIIKVLRRENAPDWFDFFDTRAFADHPDWKGCYCTGFFMPRLAEYEGASAKRRDYAAWLIGEGRMKGYMAYENGKVIAWCNVNAKAAFPKLGAAEEADPKVLSIACFTVQKEYRRRGIAQKLLDRVIKDAKKEGVAVVEAYPRKAARTEYGNYHGSWEMYAKNGFLPEKLQTGEVMRRYL